MATNEKIDAQKGKYKHGKADDGHDGRASALLSSGESAV